MRITFNLIFIFLFSSTFSFGYERNKVVDTLNNKETILLHFVDSLKKIPITSFDVIKNDEENKAHRINKFLDSTDFNELKKSCSKSRISLKLLTKIFSEAEIDSSNITGIDKDSLIIKIYQFDTLNIFNEYAITIGDPEKPWGCDIYFLKANQILESHTIMYRYGLILKSFKDDQNVTTIYYLTCNSEGAGVFQFNYNFFKYDRDSLKPVLNVLETGSFQFSIRQYYLQTQILNTEPLTIKFWYNMSIYNDTTGLEIINDSSIVKYSFDKTLGQYIGHFDDNKLSANKLCTYYCEDNDKLFINLYSDLLINLMKDRQKKIDVLFYLNEIMHDRYIKDKR
jgi:hypothetical protein